MLPNKNRFDAFKIRQRPPAPARHLPAQPSEFFQNDQPSRNHIHTVIRTPNGNDYGRDLLRQHHARFDHSRGGHAHTHSV